MKQFEKIGLKEAIDILMDPDSKYDVIIREGEGLVLRQPEHEEYKLFRDIVQDAYSEPKEKPKLRERIMKMLSDE